MEPLSSAENVGNIEELLVEILSSVPALSLIRFKSVSKRWLALISDTKFRRRHTARNPNPKISAFFSSKIQEDVFKSIPLGSPAGNPFNTLTNSVPDGRYLRILQSCNGLFLCHIPIFGEQRKHHPVYVVNPTTNEFRALSSPNRKDPSWFLGICDFVRYALAFDPSKSPHYKVVCVTNSAPSVFDHVEREGEHHKIDIYSSETEKWKHLNIPFFQSPSDQGRHYDFKEMAMHFDDRSSESAVFCNGALLWIRNSRGATVVSGPHEFRRKETDVSHYFDLAEERLALISCPPPLPDPLAVKNVTAKWPRLSKRYFGECGGGGGPYLIETYEHCMTQLYVMEMERDFSGWFLKYHVDLNPLVTAFPGLNWNVFVVLGVFREEVNNEENGEEDSSTDLWLHMPGNVMSYNLRNKAIKKSVELASKEHLQNVTYRYVEVNNYPYIETLACV